MTFFSKPPWQHYGAYLQNLLIKNSLRTKSRYTGDAKHHSIITTHLNTNPPKFLRTVCYCWRASHPFVPHYIASPIPCSRLPDSYKINIAHTYRKLQAGGSEAVIQIIYYAQQDTTNKYITFHMPTAFIPPMSSHHILLNVISSILKLCETGRKYNTDGFKLTVINYMEENGNHTLFSTLSSCDFSNLSLTHKITAVILMFTQKFLVKKSP